MNKSAWPTFNAEDAPSIELQVQMHQANALDRIAAALDRIHELMDAVVAKYVDEGHPINTRSV